jgi:hypothetical protein
VALGGVLWAAPLLLLLLLLLLLPVLSLLAPPLLLLLLLLLPLLSLGAAVVLLLLLLVVVDGRCSQPDRKAGSSHSTYWSTSFSIRRLYTPGFCFCQYLSSFGSGLLMALSSLWDAVWRCPCTSCAVCSL